MPATLTLTCIAYATGGKARLDGSGLLFLRSMCKLTRVGHAQYYKGDGHLFRDFLEEEYPDLSNECVDRAAYGTLRSK